ncbi:hypothetical protein PCC6912_39630 [Chlorogloeopsis fritschii PCC 6912]|uniref:Uncharacterized protein n=1 Tax=Chlorogloeopsis fritschii PCC 6912 TaxID=211165 RepID=A0A3S0ZPS2_CHLFR|nr:hypothetical protein [Chlorogloeopsis fritschii]RUR77004.1 hypothetical protein PCC6912_39630 [Chlorogloeopsis fritschii PCC 6912]
MKLNLLTSALAIAASISFPIAASANQIPAPSANSANWVTVGQDNQGTVVLVDAGSLKRIGSRTDFWSALKQRDGKIFLGYAIASCHRNSISPVWEIAITNNQVVESKPSPMPEFSVTRGTVPDTMFNYVCNKNDNNNMLQNLANRSTASEETINRAIESSARLFVGR